MAEVEEARERVVEIAGILALGLMRLQAQKSSALFAVTRDRSLAVSGRESGDRAKPIRRNPRE
jgi:hypothetical protein